MVTSVTINQKWNKILYLHRKKGSARATRNIKPSCNSQDFTKVPTTTNILQTIDILLDVLTLYYSSTLRESSDIVRFCCASKIENTQLD